VKGLLRLFAVLRKEVRQLRRDRLTFGMIVGIPLLQITLFGFAINTDVRHLSAGVADHANTQLSRILALDAQASQVVDVVRRVETPEQLETLLRRGEISVGIFIPSDFGQRLARRDRPAAQLMIDGSDPLILAAARQLTGMALRYDTAPRPAADAPLFEIRNYYNPERRSAVYIVPGLMGVILTMTMVLFTAVAIVRERERGNLELLINTPVRNLELMVGKIIPYVIIGLIQVSLILLLGVLLFHLSGRTGVHCRQLNDGIGDFDAGPDPVSGNADDLFLFSAVDTYFGLHVPLRRHAQGGAIHRRTASADPFRTSEPGHHVARRGTIGTVARNMGFDGVHVRHFGHRHAALQETAGLIAQRRDNRSVKTLWRAVCRIFFRYARVLKESIRELGRREFLSIRARSAVSDFSERTTLDTIG
jgi:hypothetical protein